MKKRITAAQAEAVVAARGLETRAAALEARVAMDVRRWGEGEREASRRQHRGRSHALLINSIAVSDPAAVDEELMSAAKALMTPADRAELRKGG